MSEMLSSTSEEDSGGKRVEAERSQKMDQLLWSIEKLPLIGSDEEDLANWRKVFESLEKTINFDELLSVLRTEVIKYKWSGEDKPSAIIEKVEDLVDIIRWKEKNR